MKKVRLFNENKDSLFSVIFNFETVDLMLIFFLIRVPNGECTLKITGANVT